MGSVILPNVPPSGFVWLLFMVSFSLLFYPLYFFINCVLDAKN